MSICTWTAKSFLYWQNESITNCAALSSNMFIYRACSTWDHTPPIIFFWQKAPQSVLDASDCIKISTWWELLTSYFTDLGMISTSLVPSFRVDLDLICCCNLFSGCEFVVFASTSCKVGQEDLLMLLMIMFIHGPNVEVFY